jgi:hypothetical protein
LLDGAIPKEAALNISLDEALSELEKAQTRAMWPHLLPGVAVPGALHHYTNAVGLQGILRSKSLWASDCHFLNDRSELVYRHDLVSDFLRSQSGPVAPALFRGAPPTDKKAGIYVTSFCEHGDLLSQWRGYSRLQDGYSMAFRFASLRAGKNVFLTKVLYEPRDQRENLINLLCSITEVFSRIDLPSDQTTKLIEFAVNVVWSLPFRLKDRSFEGEQEWRLVAGLGSGYTEEFRVVDGHFVPYVQIPFDAESLVEVRQGPGAYRVANTEALRRLLVAEKFDNTRVERSPVPL